MPQKIRIIGVPMDLGASRRGVDMGPSALRVAGLQSRIKQLGHSVEDIGNISVKQPEEMSYGEKRAKYIGEITDACKDLGVAEITGRRLSAPRPRRRPFHCRRIDQWRLGTLP
jgi:arginase family enzyme